MKNIYFLEEDITENDMFPYYNCSAYYEPSYFIARSYFAGGFM